MIEEIEELVNAGRYFEAHNLAVEYCRQHPDNLRVKQLCGLSMSKSGARNTAINFLEPLLEEYEDDAETAGILGGVYKEQFRMTADSSFARKSLDTYLSNFEKTRNSYTGINAATMYQILGRGKKARKIAEEVIEVSKEKDTFWSFATIGEALLLLRKSGEAYEYYLKAARLGGGQYGKLGSIYAQLLVLKHYINVPENILALFAPPKVAVFAGHMIDYNRETPRFPESIVDQIKNAIANELRIHNIKIGYSSLATGSDILFVEALLELGGEVKVFVPFDREDFLEQSVNYAGDHWVKRFEKIEQSNKIAYISKRKYDHSDVLFNFLGKVMIGAAIMRASSFHDKAYLLTVSSESDKVKKQGGTHDIRSMWPVSHEFININPDLYLDPLDRQIKESEKPKEAQYFPAEKNIRYFILGTFEVEDDNTRDQIEEVKEVVANELIEFPGTNQSGVDDEGIFALYTKAHYAMDFALRLLNIAQSKGIGVRIALEAVLIKRGAHPKTVVKESSNLKSLALSDACYATMQFSAALSAEQPCRFDYHHVGIITEGKSDEGQEIYKIDQRIQTALS